MKPDILESKSFPLDALVSKPFYDDGKIQIWNADCWAILPQLKEEPNIIITDPPYPDYYEDEYNYYDGIINPLMTFLCRQLVFWSSKVEFPLPYTAIHIWDKMYGVASEYERIFEINGNKQYKVFTYNSLSNEVSASMARDNYTGHKSQKPIKLMMDLVKNFSKKNDLILDPFMGSGSTLLAAKKLGRRGIGIEQNIKWCEVAVKRLDQFELFD